MSDATVSHYGIDELKLLLSDPPDLQAAEVQELNTAAERVLSGEAAADERAINSVYSFGLSVVPGVGDVKDAQESITGIDYITGESLKPWERAVTGFATVVPFVSGKMLRGAGRAASAADEVLEGTHGALDVLAAGARATDTVGSRPWAILPYKEARKLTEGYKGSIQAHHIVESRHLKRWGMNTNLGPSVVLSKAQHQEITNLLQKLLPTGKAYTKAEVLAAYRTAYKDFPEWLEVKEELLK